ncbi:unnamed protein product [Prorocentrum cordatum]|uniref:Uncharacterized protein n=1 Tax=Prorocentrum cordatum TaxID=2364126 RepID=A0ABN9VN59_9DINO|nr:unnamed protein product [Polarella glacialis]
MARPFGKVKKDAIVALLATLVASMLTPMLPTLCNTWMAMVQYWAHARPTTDCPAFCNQEYRFLQRFHRAHLQQGRLSDAARIGGAAGRRGNREALFHLEGHLLENLAEPVRAREPAAVQLLEKIGQRQLVLIVTEPTEVVENPRSSRGQRSDVDNPVLDSQVDAA